MKLLGGLVRANLSKKDAYTETLTQVFSLHFEKKYEHDYSARLPLEFSYVFFISKCSLLHQNNNDDSGESMTKLWIKKN